MKSWRWTLDAATARAYGIRWISARLFARIALAVFWIQSVMSVFAGPPLGGLYLNPPSSGGLCDGVITTPSARPVVRPRLWVRMACEITGVGVAPKPSCTKVSTPLAAKTLEGGREGRLRRRVRVDADVAG